MQACFATPLETLTGYYIFDGISNPLFDFKFISCLLECVSHRHHNMASRRRSCRLKPGFLQSCGTAGPKRRRKIVRGLPLTSQQRIPSIPDDSSNPMQSNANLAEVSLRMASFGHGTVVSGIPRLHDMGLRPRDPAYRCRLTVAAPGPNSYEHPSAYEKRHTSR